VSDTIIMRHPTLPERQEIEVPRDAMPHYTAAGWQLVPQEELDERAAAKARADAEAAAAEETAGPQTEDEPERSEPAEAPTERPARSRRAHDKKTEEN
jgi:hypothetical protein